MKPGLADTMPEVRRLAALAASMTLTVLYALRNGPMYVHEVVEATGAAQNSVGALLSKGKDHGLVCFTGTARRPSKWDLTNKGRALLDGLERAAATEN